MEIVRVYSCPWYRNQETQDLKRREKREAGKIWVAKDGKKGGPVCGVFENNRTNQGVGEKKSKNRGIVNKYANHETGGKTPRRKKKKRTYWGGRKRKL